MRYDTRYGRPYPDRWERSPRDPGFLPREGHRRHRVGPYGADYWWLGERAFEAPNRAAPYDESYRRFSEAHHPRFTPVGGMYPAIGGAYAGRRPPPLREPRWFSDWTRWF